MIKKKKFLEKDSVADMMELLGEELDMEAEFNDLDNENTEKVQGYLHAPWIPDFGVSTHNIGVKRPPFTIYAFPGYVLWNNKLGLQEDNDEEHCCKKVEGFWKLCNISQFMAAWSRGAYFLHKPSNCLHTESSRGFRIICALLLNIVFSANQMGFIQAKYIWTIKVRPRLD